MQCLDPKSVAADAALSVFGVDFTYSGSELSCRKVLTDVSFSLSPGEILCLVGPSGCGKTTLLDLIAGFLQPSAGSVQIGSGDRQAKIGYIFQTDALLPWRKVRDNLLLVAEIQKRSEAAFETRLVKYLDAFHLKSEHLELYPSQLSGGMRQRVSIIQSLLFDPALLLLDEPFSALDFFTKLSLEAEFKSMIKTENKAALLITHDIEEAIAMADRIILMNSNGAVVREYSIEFSNHNCSPEEVRGLAGFAHYYNAIRADLKTVMTV